MSNFSIASILNLPSKKDDITDMAYLLQQQAAVMTALDRNTPQSFPDMAPTEVDLNQNLKKKRGRKKGSKNRPKDVIMKEKLKRSKSENDTVQVAYTAPNLPLEETCENEFLCAWCKKLFSSAMGRMRHSIHCNWNPERINKLKAKRKKSREDICKTPSKSSRLDSTHVPPPSVTKVPLFENGRKFGEKVVPLKRSISEPPIKSEIKTEPISAESDDFGQLLPNVHVKSEPL